MGAQPLCCREDGKKRLGGGGVSPQVRVSLGLWFLNYIGFFPLAPSCRISPDSTALYKTK